MRKIRVLIVEDSRVVRQLLEHIVGNDPRLEVAGSVGSAEEALRILDRVRPDVISMDIRLPGMNGFEATQKIMSERPTPIVVVSASIENEELRITMNALAAGALTVLEKPVGNSSAGYEAMATRIRTQLVIMSQVKVVRRHGAPRATPLVPQRPAGPALADFRALGIVCSTGGPGALVRLLGALGPAFALPILLVQHIAAPFLEGFAAWLRSMSPLPVIVVDSRVPLTPGAIHIAAADRHLVGDRNSARASFEPPFGGQRPSGTILFRSLAEAFGPAAIGALLTGMGDDGADGLLQLRERGGYTIAEDESTAVVFGMPAAALRLGAVRESLPLSAIAPRILGLTHSRQEVA